MSAGLGQSPSERLFRLTTRANIPLMMTLELTYRCPLSCEHCYLPETQGAAPVRQDEELTLDEWKRVLDELAEAGTLHLVVTGGEVLVRKDLHPFLAHCRQNGFDVKLFTSGLTMTERDADLIVENGVGQVELSLYGSRPYHEKVTRREGSFEKTVAAVKMLRARGQRVMVKTPIMASNHPDLAWLIGFAKDHGCTYRLDPSLAPRNDRASKPMDLRMQPEQLMDVLYDENMITAREIQGVAETNEDKNFICGAGKNVGGINPFGEVFPCTQLQIPSGNVRERSFGAIWFGSQKLEDYRKITFEDLYACKTCEIREYCARCPGITNLESGDLLGPSSAACRVTLATVERLHGKTDYVPPGLRPEYMAKTVATARDENPFDVYLPRDDAAMSVTTWHEREARDGA